MKKTNSLPFEIRKKDQSNEALASQLADIAKKIDWVDVTKYGAKGDGITDDSASIQSAISALNNKKYGVLYFPEGDYRIEHAYAQIIGCTNLTITGDNARIFRTSASTPKEFLGIYTSKNVLISGLTFEGVGFTDQINTNEDGLGIYGGCENVVVERVTFKNLGGCSLRMGGGNSSYTTPIKNAWVNKCVFDKVFQSSTLPVGVKNYYFTNNVLTQVGGACKFSQRYGLGNTLFIQGNVIETLDTIYVQGGIEIFGYQNVSIKDNQITSNWEGISIYCAEASDTTIVTPKDYVIEGNTIISKTRNGILFNNNRGSAMIENIRIRKNKITATTNGFYCVGFIGQQVHNVTISDNEFYDNSYYVIGWETTRTIDATIDSNVTIRRNKLIRCKGGIVTTKPLIRALVEGNEQIKCTGNFFTSLTGGDSQKITFKDNFGVSTLGFINSDPVKATDFILDGNVIECSIFAYANMDNVLIKNNKVINSNVSYPLRLTSGSTGGSEGFNQWVGSPSVITGTLSKLTV